MAPEWEAQAEVAETSFEVEYPTPSSPTTPLTALGWLLFLVALVCSPAVVVAVYGWAL